MMLLWPPKTCPEEKKEDLTIHENNTNTSIALLFLLFLSCGLSIKFYGEKNEVTNNRIESLHVRDHLLAARFLSLSLPFIVIFKSCARSNPWKISRLPLKRTERAKEYLIHYLNLLNKSENEHLQRHSMQMFIVQR